MVTFKKYHLENISYWLIIISITFFCATGKFSDDLYTFILGIIIGNIISIWKNNSKKDN